jgi:hypothetical protein
MFFGAHRVPRALLPVAVALAIATSALVTAPPASASAPTCWQRVIAEWRDGRLEGTYSSGCLHDAIRNLPEDLRIYGSAEEDINRAMNRAVTRSLQSASIAAPKAATPDLAAHADAFPVRAAIVATVTGLVALAVAASLWRSRRRRS